MNPFEEALDRIRSSGWIQGELARPGEGYCLEGAFLFAQPSKCHLEYYPLIRKVLGEQYGWGYSVYIWNDQPERTQAEVETILEKCAVRWDENAST